MWPRNLATSLCTRAKEGTPTVDGGSSALNTARPPEVQHATKKPDINKDPGTLLQRGPVQLHRPVTLHRIENEQKNKQKKQQKTMNYFSFDICCVTWRLLDLNDKQIVFVHRHTTAVRIRATREEKFFLISLKMKTKGGFFWKKRKKCFYSARWKMVRKWKK